jgi:hypothetical protein
MPHSKPPIPPARNPKRHHEKPGEPPANWPDEPAKERAEELDRQYEAEGIQRAEDRIEPKREALNNPK